MLTTDLKVPSLTRRMKLCWADSVDAELSVTLMAKL
jgi:hypothetical protein